MKRNGAEAFLIACRAEARTANPGNYLAVCISWARKYLISSPGGRVFEWSKGLSTTFTVHYHSGLLLLRLLLKAMPRSAERESPVHQERKEKSKRRRINFWNMLVSRPICWVSRRAVSWDFLSCLPRWPNGLRSCNCTDIVPSSRSLTSMSKKLPVCDTLVEHWVTSWLLPRPLQMNNCCSICQQSCEMNDPRLKITILSSCYQPSVHWLSSLPCKRIPLPVPD